MTATPPKGYPTCRMCPFAFVPKPPPGPPCELATLTAPGSHRADSLESEAKSLRIQGGRCSSQGWSTRRRGALVWTHRTACAAQRLAHRGPACGPHVCRCPRFSDGARAHRASALLPYTRRNPPKSAPTGETGASGARPPPSLLRVRRATSAPATGHPRTTSPCSKTAHAAKDLTRRALPRAAARAGASRHARRGDRRAPPCHGPSPVSHLRAGG